MHCGNRTRTHTRASTDVPPSPPTHAGRVQAPSLTCRRAILSCAGAVGLFEYFLFPKVRSGDQRLLDPS